MNRKLISKMFPDRWLRITYEVIVGKIYLDTNVTQKDIL